MLQRLVPMGVGVIGIAGDRLAIARDRVVGAPLLLADQGQIIVRMRAVWLGGGRPFIFPRGLVDSAQRLQGGAEIGMRLGMVRVQLERLAMGADRLFEAPTKLKDRAQRIIGLGRRRERDGPPALGFGLFQPSGGLERRRQIGPEIREIGFECDRAADQFDRGFMPPALVGDKSEQVEAVDLGGRVPQNPEIERLGRIEIAGAMMADRSRQKFALGTAGHIGPSHKNSADDLSSAEHQSILDRG